MNQPIIILEKKYIHLKQLLIDGQIELFEIETAQLQFDELLEFSYYAFKSYSGQNFLEDYYGVKILGELTYLTTIQDIIVLNPKSFEEEKFRELIFKGLASAAHKSLDLGYFKDAEKYGCQVIKYPKIDNETLLTFLSNLAICANKNDDVQKELFYCEEMLKISDKDPKIFVNYAYALMRNKKYDKSKIFLEKCLSLDYKEFQVYNQLAVVTIYGYKDYETAFSYIEQIFNMSDKGKKLNDRNRYLMFSNSLTICGLSGKKKLLEYIVDFKNSTKAIPDKNVSHQWNELAEICELMNKGIFELEKGHFSNAQRNFTEINEYNWKGQMFQLAEFLNKICSIIQDHERIKNIEDVELLLDYVRNLEVIDLFQDYKDIIEDYFYLLYSLMMILNDENINIDIESKKEKLQKYYRLNLTTSDFITRSFNLIELIECYKIDYSVSILKESVKQEYMKKLSTLINTHINITNETTFLYSLNTVGDINKALCELIVKIIHLIQKNEPTFIKSFKSGNNFSLLETDFRDIFYRSFGLSYDIEISAEALSRVGRTDLQIESKKFGTKTFEFKIWGSNDYKDVVKQIYEYLTDFEKDGFVFMINKNQKGIKKDYINNLQRPEMGYIHTSTEIIIIADFEIIVSKHEIHEMTKTIYHFIYNIY